MMAQAIEALEPSLDVEPLPADLRSWIGGSGLAGLTLDVVREFRTQSSGRAGAAARYADDPRLALLTACYAAGMFHSEEIGMTADNDPMMRELCAGWQPTSANLARFRRENRQLLADCLAQVLVQAWWWRIGGAGVDIETDAMVEARRRVQQAVVYDLGLGRE